MCTLTFAMRIRIEAKPCRCDVTAAALYSCHLILLICSGVGMTESNFYTDKTLYFMHMKVLCEREGANDLFNESG